jgi:hypothetical protein
MQPTFIGFIIFLGHLNDLKQLIYDCFFLKHHCFLTIKDWLNYKEKLTTLREVNNMNKLKVASAGFKALALSVLAFSAQATNLVTNGSFETTSNGPGQFDYNTTATGWTSTGDSYNFIFASGSADTTGSNGQYGNLQLWGPGNGSANGLPATSPDGGNFVGADGAFQVGAITQIINGLITGNTYTVSFWWAGAQQSGFDGATTDKWDVSLGSETHSTSVVSLPSHGFTGWMQESFTYTATTTGSEVLSFLATGTPTGVPPFALLDGVSLNANAVPEPETLVLLGIGVAGMLAVRRQQKNRRA